jgi:hypothetical protein
MIPPCLENSNEFQWMAESERHDFKARLAYCIEILEKLRLLPDPSDKCFFSELDDIELDVYSVMSLGGISPYQVHSSWTFNCKRETMFQALPVDFENFLACPVPGPRSSPSQDRNWLHKFCNNLEGVFRAFEHAEIFDDAIANRIAVDVMMAMLLQYSGNKRLG